MSPLGVLAVLTVCSLASAVGGFAQHPGAYSSPHYVKYRTPSLQPTAEPPTTTTTPPATQLEPKSSVGGGGFFASGGGRMLADIARELLARSTGATSQVLSLNLTNLVILVVLKALILAAGMFGAGAWTHGHARSEDSALIDESELALWMGYLRGGDRSCLKRASCRRPILAEKYVGGADLLLAGAKIFSRYDSEYQEIVDEVRQAAELGASGADCDSQYLGCPE